MTEIGKQDENTEILVVPSEDPVPQEEPVEATPEPVEPELVPA